jgi:hypothetical protein
MRAENQKMMEASVLWAPGRRWQPETAPRARVAAVELANGTSAASLRYSPGWPLVMALGVSTMMWAVIVWGVLKLF